MSFRRVSVRRVSAEKIMAAIFDFNGSGRLVKERRMH